MNSAMPCLWPLLCVAGNTSLLEPQPRRSVSQTANCTSCQALLCSVSRDRPRWSFLPSRPLCRRSSHVAALHESALSICVWGDRGSLPWTGFPLLRPPGRDPAEAQSLRLFAAVAAAAVCLVVSGHSSTQTCSNLIGPVCMSGGACCCCGVLCSSSRACAVPRSKDTSSAPPSGRCSRIPPPRGLVEGLFAP